MPLGLAAALLSPVPLWAQTPLTLEQALELAAARSPAIAAALKEVQAADGAVSQAGAWRNPELNATVEDTQRATRTTTATIDIPLELGGKRGARVTVAERARDLAAAELAHARAEIAAKVVSAWFGALVTQERAKLALGSADIAARAAEAAGKRVSAGKFSPVEETRAKVDQANAQLEAAEAAAELENARFALAATLGDPELKFETLSGDLAALPMRPALAELFARLEASPSLLSAQLELERRRALVAVERSKATPDMTLSIGAKRDNEQGRTQAVVGFSVPIPVFDRNQGGVLEASRRAEKASDELQIVRLRLLAELQESSSRLAVARTSLQTLQSIVLPSAQQAYESASKGFEAGKFSFLEVLDAQRSLLQARSRYLNTLAAAWQAAAAIDRIVGR